MGHRDGRLSDEQERFVQQVEEALVEQDKPYVDPLTDAVEDECPTCGAYMLNPALHRDWHADTDRRFRTIDAEARRYRPSPRYGGRQV